MIKLLKGQNNTWVIQNGVCHPKNKVGGLDEKDLKKLLKLLAFQLMRKQDQSRKFCPCCDCSLE